jgi:hypothetical protein
VPAIMPDDDIGLAFDMHGCPNRCRHCWLDHQVVATPRTRMSEDDVRWAVAQFHAFRRPGEDRAPWRRLNVATWIREPDYADDYRQLCALEIELSDVPPPRDRYELMSVWRLARDPEYADWGRGLGIRECQITFFGLEKATDWAVRRSGAFQDLVIATERLLAAGIRPRWQVIFTKMLVPDLPGLIALAEELRLRKRCEKLGKPFTFWMHLPTPGGAALDLDYVWPTDRDLDRVPRDFLAQSEARIGGPIGTPERVLYRALRDDPGPAIRSVKEATSGNPVWFYIAPGFDVYLTFAAISPAYRLGNLKTDGVANVTDAYEHDRTPGQQAMFHTPTADLARRYGRPYGRRLYDGGDLQWRWAELLARGRGEAPRETEVTP